MPSSEPVPNSVPELVEVGLLTRPHGIRGELCLDYYAESLDLLQCGQVYVQAGNRPPRRMEVASVRLHRGMPLVRFAEVPDRTAAEVLRGQKVLVPQASLPELEEDEVYLNDVLGLPVYLDEDGRHLGTLDHVLFHGEQEVWVIVTPDSREVLLPAVPEFVTDIDLDAGRIVIAPPEGLLELYLGQQ